MMNKRPDLIDVILSLHSENIYSCDSSGGIFWKDGHETTEQEIQAIQAELVRLQAEYDAQQYQRDRAKEYPDFKDYLDGIVKGDTAQAQAYIDACNAVKAKYPKG
jgi:hypothetical protein